MGYAPQLPLQKWRLVQDFVVDCALRVDYAKAKDVREVMLPLTRLALWATQSEGLPLKPRVLLDPATVRRFAATQEKALQRREYERRLLLVREALGAERSARVMGRPGVTPVTPLTAHELAEMSTWVQAMEDEAQKRLGMALMGLCGGAGLRRAEAHEVTVQDVEPNGTGYVVHVRRGAKRSIAVLRSFERYLARVLKDAKSDEFLVKAGRSTERTRKDLRLRHNRDTTGRMPNAERLRASWVATMCPVLTAGELVYASGLKHFSSLAQYEPFFTVPDPAEMHEVLRDPATLGGAK
ncbi:hypothetical protein DEJ25_13615 [Curtobacterium sp. MCPF17_011]|uniref:hypothetical protein n=1 Tax=Curtobacterium sp. MCPF17_011 TaxID=2175652 RepID=UPI000DA9CE08|nr:hypothetical protein [Curtobacterium sp. MCPF17_011]PZF10006.1 hypothetical protein DEJ25_13615 [Curtobacterium sp. MCPF17_011]